MSVNATWTTVKGDMEGNGVAFMLALFAKHSALQNEFPKLKGKGAGALKSDGAMKAQAMAVMNAVDGCVAGNSAKVLGDIAKTHVPRGITIGYMQTAFDCFLDFIVAAGGDQGAWAGVIGDLKAEVATQFKAAGGK